MNAGDVFKFVGIADIHFWVVLSDPAIDAASVLIVNFTSWDKLEDQSCLLEKGEHSVITHRTCVAYSRARVVPDEALEKLRSSGRLQLLTPVSDGLLEKMRQRAMESTRISLDHAQILIDQNLAE